MTNEANRTNADLTLADWKARLSECKEERHHLKKKVKKLKHRLEDADHNYKIDRRKVKKKLRRCKQALEAEKDYCSYLERKLEQMQYEADIAEKEQHHQEAMLQLKQENQDSISQMEKQHQRDIHELESKYRNEVHQLQRQVSCIQTANQHNNWIADVFMHEMFPGFVQKYGKKPRTIDAEYRICENQDPTSDF